MPFERGKLETQLEQWSNGSMDMAALVALLIGIAIGALLF